MSKTRLGHLLGPKTFSFPSNVFLVLTDWLDGSDHSCQNLFLAATVAFAVVVVGVVAAVVVAANVAAVVVATVAFADLVVFAAAVATQ